MTTLETILLCLVLLLLALGSYLFYNYAAKDENDEDRAEWARVPWHWKALLLVLWPFLVVYLLYLDATE